jgi:hypothetical protein
MDMPEAMRRFSNVFDPGKLTMFPDALTVGPKADVPEELPEKIDVESLYHPPAIPVPDWDDLRQRPLAGLSATDVPLNRLLIILGQLLNVGIGWELDSVRLSGGDIDQGCSVTVEQQSFLEGVEPALKACGVVVGQGESGWPRLSFERELLRQKIPSAWSLADLALEEQDWKEWETLLRQLYPESVTRFTRDRDRLVWSKEATLEEQATVAAFLDQSRQARGLPVQSTLPSDVIHPVLGLDTLSNKLEAVSQRIIPESFSISQALDLAAREVGLQLLMDWPVLYEHGFSHAYQGSTLIKGRTWPAIARRTLDRFNLVAVLDGPNRVVLTTLPRQRRMWRTIVLTLPANKSLENVRDALRPLSPVDADGRSTLMANLLPGRSGDNRKWIVLRLCPPNTRQWDLPAIQEIFGRKPSP